MERMENKTITAIIINVVLLILLATDFILEKKLVSPPPGNLEG
jgi:hypothetical protein